MTAAVLPTLGTMKRDWMKEPRALTMSLNTLVECCFMSYDWQNELVKKEKSTKLTLNVKYDHVNLQISSSNLWQKDISLWTKAHTSVVVSRGR